MISNQKTYLAIDTADGKENRISQLLVNRNHVQFAQTFSFLTRFYQYLDGSVSLKMKFLRFLALNRFEFSLY